MANNKLWAVCKNDNKAKRITKYDVRSGWGDLLDHDGIDLEQFMNEHNDCPANKGCGENILFVSETDDRVELYDFHELDNPRIYFK